MRSVWVGVLTCLAMGCVVGDVGSSNEGSESGAGSESGGADTDGATGTGGTTDPDPDTGGSESGDSGEWNGDCSAVQFEDPVLEEAVRLQLDLADGEPIEGEALAEVCR